LTSFGELSFTSADKMAVAEDVVDMNIAAVIGFSGDVPNGLTYTPYVIVPVWLASSSTAANCTPINRSLALTAPCFASFIQVWNLRGVPAWVSSNFKECAN
jgi:hypothetical protein